MVYDIGMHLLYPQTEIESNVKRLASEITADYHDKNPLLIGILKGSFVFMADLVRVLDFDLEVEFVRLSSYESGRESTGKIQMVQGLRAVVRDRHVLLVEDIVDTGLTVSSFLRLLKNRKPASLRLCAMMDKPSRRQVPLEIDYLGLTVPDKFIVGYGLDYAEKYRNLPDLFYLEDEQDA